MAPRNILQLSTEEKRKFLYSFDLIFSDIDGVVWNVYDKIEGAADALKMLENAGKEIYYLTNNSARPMATVVKKFQDIDMNIDINKVLHPAKSIVDYLKSIQFDGLIYAIATETFKEYLKAAGFQYIDGPNSLIDESFPALAAHLFDKHPIRAVIIDIDFNLSSTKILKAHFYLRNPECLLITGATDTLLPVHKDINILGPGPFSKILNDNSEQRMITLGKPGKDLAEILIRKYNITNSKRALMIGDMLEQDIGFGKACDFQTLLVLSGGCKIADLSAETNPNNLPDYYAESLGDFVEFIKDINKSNV